ncbi:hypothetical protein BU16DRAFT_555432 [Lophium mytilinum]|uniref:Uncharacterized protein n=1 Tax=Lophium mytilinum TaxID=390894 RepID=A0A6A6RB28_9PEZI|nr:hypothetical protein BU16DRAFT_555432 [Lophium mytilinum]
MVTKDFLYGSAIDRAYFFTVSLSSFLDLLDNLPRLASRKQYSNYLAERVLENILPAELRVVVADLLQQQDTDAILDEQNDESKHPAGYAKLFDLIRGWRWPDRTAFWKYSIPEIMTLRGEIAQGFDFWYWFHALLPTVLDPDVIPAEKPCECSLCKNDSAEEWTRQLSDISSPQDPGLAPLPYAHPNSMVQQLHTLLRSVDDGSPAAHKFRKVIPKLEALGLHLVAQKDFDLDKPWIIEICTVFQYSPTKEFIGLKTWDDDYWTPRCTEIFDETMMA